MAPYATFVNTASLWAFDPTDTTPPAPIFAVLGRAPHGIGGRLGGERPHPLLLDVRRDLEWNPTARLPALLLGIARQPARRIPDGGCERGDHDGADTANGPWVENSEGGLEVQVNSPGSGPLVVMRNGTAITGTWHRSSLTQPATLTNVGRAADHPAAGEHLGRAGPERHPGHDDTCFAIDHRVHRRASTTAP